MRIGYFTNQYPAISHTFIRREIRALEAEGVTIVRYAVRPGAERIVDPDDVAEHKQTRYILSAGASEVVRCVTIALFKQPFRVISAVRLAISVGWRSDRGVLRHLGYAAEAAVLATWCHENSVEHLHAHFGTNPAAVAMLASKISGLPYS